MKLLIATRNGGKLDDYRAFCAGTKLDAVSLKDEGIDQDFEEIYDSFEENAKAKAEFYFKLSGLPTLADDSGIEIPYYGMAPGVRTKRWAGENVGEKEYLEFIKNKIRALPADKNRGQMRAVLALCLKGDTYLAEGIIKGKFTSQAYSGSFTPGYPWDSLFILDQNNKYYEALTPEENLQINHRRIAFEILKPKLENHADSYFSQYSH